MMNKKFVVLAVVVIVIIVAAVFIVFILTQQPKAPSPYAGLEARIATALEVAKLTAKRPDYLLLLAWNYAPAIMHREQVLRSQGTKFIIPVPKVRVV